MGVVGAMVFPTCRWQRARGTPFVLSSPPCQPGSPPLGTLLPTGCQPAAARGPRARGQRGQFVPWTEALRTQDSASSAPSPGTSPWEDGVLPWKFPRSSSRQPDTWDTRSYPRWAERRAGLWPDLTVRKPGNRLVCKTGPSWVGAGPEAALGSPTRPPGPGLICRSISSLRDSSAKGGGCIGRS